MAIIMAIWMTITVGTYSPPMAMAMTMIPLKSGMGQVHRAFRLGLSEVVLLGMGLRHLVLRLAQG
jgi:hypothetical protein